MQNTGWTDNGMFYDHDGQLQSFDNANKSGLWSGNNYSGYWVYKNNGQPVGGQNAEQLWKDGNGDMLEWYSIGSGIKSFDSGSNSNSGPTPEQIAQANATASLGQGAVSRAQTNRDATFANLADEIAARLTQLENTKKDLENQFQASTVQRQQDRRSGFNSASGAAADSYTQAVQQLGSVGLDKNSSVYDDIVSNANNAYATNAFAVNQQFGKDQQKAEQETRRAQQQADIDKLTSQDEYQGKLNEARDAYSRAADNAWSQILGTGSVLNNGQATADSANADLNANTQQHFQHQYQGQVPDYIAPAQNTYYRDQNVTFGDRSKQKVYNWGQGAV